MADKDGNYRSPLFGKKDKERLSKCNNMIVLCLFGSATVLCVGLGGLSILLT